MSSTDPGAASSVSRCFHWEMGPYRHSRSTAASSIWRTPAQSFARAPSTAEYSTVCARLYERLACTCPPTAGTLLRPVNPLRPDYQQLPSSISASMFSAALTPNAETRSHVRIDRQDERHARPARCAAGDPARERRRNARVLELHHRAGLR